MRSVVLLLVLICSTVYSASFQIVFTSDVHERLSVSGSGPMGLVEWLKDKDRTRLLVMDGGDLFDQKIQLPFFFDNRNLVMDYVKRVDYDAMVPGNHEFYFGKRWFEEYSKANPNLLAVNIDGLPDYEVFEVVGKRILVIGLAGIQHLANQIEHQGNLPEDPLKALEKTMKDLPEVDYVICISHLNHSLEKQIAESFPQIDLILSGHDHRGPELKKINRTYLFEAGSHANSTYLITVDLSTRQVRWEQLTPKVEKPIAENQNLHMAILLAVLLGILSIAWINFNP